ncbi:hypothetical protein M3Y94_00575500 [Aphelenchoides besseyi]|nr:hypothetical protein M3Y94_00575500 [Aphelenchoides besseyi]KAI6218051.1 putative zinc finger protein [Aphelenchoides besseyi]
MATADKTLHPLEKYREAFIRNYQLCFRDLPDESQRIEAVNRIFNNIKTPSELANIALNLRALLLSTPQPLIETVGESKVDGTTEEDAIDLTRNGSTSPDPTDPNGDKAREKPAQNKLAREIELINKRIYGLFEQRKLRELSADEQNEMRNALSIREDLRKRLKKTQDAAVRAKRYRIRKAHLMSTDSDFGLESPAIKFSRSLSSNVLMSSDEELQLEGRIPREQLTILTRPLFKSFDDSHSIAVNAIGLTPTPELSNLKISSAFSASSIKIENISPTVEPEVISLDCVPGLVAEKNRDSSSTTESETTAVANVSPQCQNCNATFSNLNEFIDHMRTTHLNSTENELRCRLCDRQFPTSQERLMHLTEHYTSTSATYKCQKCEKTFPTASNFRQHFATAHTELLFRCNVCFRVFTDNNLYQEHMNSHFVEETIIECAMCSVQFDTDERFLAHIQLVHDRDTEPLISIIANCEGTHSPSLDRMSAETSKTVKSLKCFVCDRRYNDETLLDIHRLHSHCKVLRSDRCAVCRQPMSNLEDFFAHTKEHCADQAEVSCVICRQTVRNEILLKMHGEYHLSFDENAQQIMTNHILQHSMETNNLTNDLISSSIGSFVCSCGQKFDDSNELQIHSLEHLKEVTTIVPETDNFACPKCSKVFASLSALQGHSHVHIPRKFSCSKCRQVFSTQARLQAHWKRHISGKTKGMKCEICDKKFEHADALVDHMRNHTESLTTPSNTTDSN